MHYEIRTSKEGPSYHEVFRVDDDGVENLLYEGPGEPEDASLYRDFAWVLTELNWLAGLLEKTLNSLEGDKG